MTDRAEAFLPAAIGMADLPFQLACGKMQRDVRKCIHDTDQINIMKKLSIITSILLTICLSSNGQWYLKKYGVNDINYLTEEHLTESLNETKVFAICSWSIAIAGGLSFFYGQNFLRNKNPFELTVIQKSIGQEKIGKGFIILGLGMFSAGAVSGLVDLSRMVKIKSVIKQNPSHVGLLSISPSVILNNFPKGFSPGIEIKINF